MKRLIAVLFAVGCARPTTSPATEAPVLAVAPELPVEAPVPEVAAPVATPAERAQALPYDVAWEGGVPTITPDPSLQESIDPDEVNSEFAAYCEDISLPDNLPDNRPVWWTNRYGKVMPKGHKGSRRRGDVLVRAHAKTTKAYRDRMRKIVLMVANAMAGRDANRLTALFMYREIRYNLSARHKRKADLRAARLAWKAHLPDPERIAELEGYVEICKSHRCDRTRLYESKAELRRRTLYIDNPTIWSKNRWRTGLGVGFVLPYKLWIYDRNAPPEVFCLPIPTVYTLINDFRRIADKAIAQGIKPTALNIARAYGTGGSFRERTPKMKPDGTMSKDYDANFIASALRHDLDPHAIPLLGTRGSHAHEESWEEAILDRPSYAKRPDYAKREKTCAYRRNKETREWDVPRPDHVWHDKRCWYQHVSKRDYILQLEAFVEKHIPKTVSREDQVAMLD